MFGNTYQITYANGDFYRGQVKNNKFHGKGIYSTKKYRF